MQPLHHPAPSHVPHAHQFQAASHWPTHWLQEPSAADSAEGGGREQGGAAAEPHFKREVAETYLRCVKEHISHDNVVIELNGLKIAEDKTFADCARCGNAGWGGVVSCG